MRHFIARLCRLSICVFRRSVLLAGLGFCMVYSVVADDIAVSEQTFDCILEWPKVRNTRIKHSDPEKLKEATRIFGDSIPDREYPVGTILQLVPFEAMVKHPREKFPKTNGWEFFSLDVSEAGTVRRQSFWDRERLKIRESLARLVFNVRRPADGAASGDWRLSFV